MNNTVGKKTFAFVCFFATIFFIISTILFIHGGYLKKIISKISPPKQIAFQAKYDDVELDAWNNCLEQLQLDTDIVFFGDSITERSNFSNYFPDKSICNLGIGSDTILGMIERVDMIETVSPEKVFIMAGINSLRNNTLDKSVSEYNKLMESLNSKGFQEVFVFSVLPLSMEKSNSIGCSKETIVAFNSSIKDIVAKYGFTFIDLHSKFISSDGFIKQEYTTDGAHLTESAYDVWANEIQPFIK